MLIKAKKNIKLVYAGDRQIAVKVLKFIISQGYLPDALMVAEGSRASHAKELLRLYRASGGGRVLTGKEFRRESALQILRKLNPDFIICVHFPYIIPQEALAIPRRGVLNLHPAYLPYNRGWHTPTWAIWDKTPYGATLHFMDEGVDTGDIIHQRQIKVLPSDTADNLYQRVLDLEYEVFQEAWPSLLSANFVRKIQKSSAGTFHRRRDLDLIQRIAIKKAIKGSDLIRLLRALTTNSLSEAAYFKENNKIYRLQIKVVEGKEI